MKYFITYADSSFVEAKERILQEAERSHVFDDIIAYSPENLSPQLRTSSLMKIRRGGGLWSWKPDVILSTMNQCEDGDIIVYADAGCTIEKSKEWQKYFDILSGKCDIIALRIFQKNIQWTRKEIIDHFHFDNKRWLNNFQFQATIFFEKFTFYSFVRNRMARYYAFPS